MHYHSLAISLLGFVPFQLTAVSLSEEHTHQNRQRHQFLSEVHQLQIAHLISQSVHHLKYHEISKFIAKPNGIGVNSVGNFCLTYFNIRYILYEL